MLGSVSYLIDLGGRNGSGRLMALRVCAGRRCQSNAPGVWEGRVRGCDVMKGEGEVVEGLLLPIPASPYRWPLQNRTIA